MKLTPFAKIFIAVVILAVVGYVIYARVPPLHGGIPVTHGTDPGPSASGTSGPSAQPGRAETVILRLCGSNTIGAKLMPELVEAFLRQQGHREVHSTPGKSADELTVRGVQPSDGSTQVVEINSRGSAKAFVELGTGKCDIGMSSRRIKPEEATALGRLGDMTSLACEHVLGLDGVAVIVHRGNPVHSLNLDQLGRLFSGEISDWKDVGGKAGPVKPYRRDDHSGTTDTFAALVMGKRSFAAAVSALEDSRLLAERVAADPAAVGFVGLAYLQGVRALAVADAGAKSLVPNRLTVATEDYPLSRRLFLYTAASQTPLVRRLIDFVESKAGQDLVASAGFVSQNVTSVSSAPDSGGPVEYRRLSAGAERLSLDFRFQSGRTQLDNKALLDLDRVVTFISDLHYTGEQVMLFGFADGRGSRDVNARLSRERAQVVAGAFEQRGLKLSVVTGFGSELPIASNDTEEGRDRNRRVEIWVRKGRR